MALGNLVANAEVDPLQRYRDTASRWSDQIENFRLLDAKGATPENAILVIGSSSIRFWDTIHRDLAPFPVIQRGFGGASISDAAVYADDLIKPHNCRAVVFFVGARDASGKDGEKTPEEICLLANYLVQKVREHQGAVPVVFMEITPCPARVYLRNKVGQINSVLSAVCSANQNVYWLETSNAFLKDGAPLPGLFAKDRIHLSQQGYAVWATLLSQTLSQSLQSQTSR